MVGINFTYYKVKHRLGIANYLFVGTFLGSLASGAVLHGTDNILEDKKYSLHNVHSNAQVQLLGEDIAINVENENFNEGMQNILNEYESVQDQDYPQLVSSYPEKHRSKRESPDKDEEALESYSTDDEEEEEPDEEESQDEEDLDDEEEREEEAVVNQDNAVSSQELELSRTLELDEEEEQERARDEAIVAKDNDGLVQAESKDHLEESAEKEPEEEEPEQIDEDAVAAQDQAVSKEKQPPKSLENNLDEEAVVSHAKPEQIQTDDNKEQPPVLHKEHHKNKTDKHEDKKGLDENSKHKNAEKTLENIFNFMPREQAHLANFSDFPSDWREIQQDISVGITEIREIARRSKFRSHRRRRKHKKHGYRSLNLNSELERPVKRWEHKERIHKDDPQGCGYPICVDVDMRPKRFESMCRFVKWLKENGHERRIFVVQKGGCEDVIDGKQKDSTWVPIEGHHSGAYDSNKEGIKVHNPCDKPHMHKWKDSPICNTPVCINALGFHETGIANSFENVMTVMDWFVKIGRRERNVLQNVLVIAVGLGKCDELYRGNLLTESFDFDDPCTSPSDQGDAEDMISAFNFLKGISYLHHRRNSTGHSNTVERFIGRHRCCTPANVVQDTFKFVTMRGTDKTTVPNERQAITTTPYQVKCSNTEMPETIPEPPYYWDSALKVRCIDWKFSYECRHMWGETQLVKGYLDKPGFDVLKQLVHDENHDALVDRPARTRGIFEGCDWKPFISTEYGRKRDVEMRTRILSKNKKFSKHVCGDAKFMAMFIDTRTVEHDTPWDETEDFSAGGITKNTPFSGFYCESKNQNQKPCEDYKVRFCCVKDKVDQWTSWSPWSRCTKSCGGGKQEKHRKCHTSDHNRRAEKKFHCFGFDNPDYSRQERDCNLKDCPVNYAWEEWKAWSTCSASCGKGIKKRDRICRLGSDGGKDCPPDTHKEHNEYRETKECFMRKCSLYTWADWGGWSECSASSKFDSYYEEGHEKPPVKCGMKGIQVSDRYCHDVNYCFQKTSIPKDHCANGTAMQQQSCEGDPCIIDGGWSKWRKWSDCDVKCGQGKRRRKRDCTNPFPSGGGKECQGKDEEAEPCDKGPCPINCKWSAWGAWSKCSVSCGSNSQAGTRERYRHEEVEGKHGGIPCSCCKPKEVEECIHCTVRPGRPEAEDRQRSEKEFTEHCIPHCPVDCTWTPWSQWSGPCKPCVQARHQKHKRYERRERYVDTYPEYGGNLCEKLEGKKLDTDQGEEGREVIKRKCQSPDCPKVAAMPYWANWQDWSTCKASADTPCHKELRSGKRTRTRDCQEGRDRRVKTLRPDDCRKQRHLKGADHEDESCIPPCTSFPIWSTWTPWSECNVKCGVGKKHRTRQCNEIPDPLHKYKRCKIGKKETQDDTCDMGPCGRHRTPYEEDQPRGKSPDAWIEKKIPNTHYEQQAHESKVDPFGDWEKPSEPRNHGSFWRAKHNPKEKHSHGKAKKEEEGSTGDTSSGPNEKKEINELKREDKIQGDGNEEDGKPESSPPEESGEILKGDSVKQAAHHKHGPPHEKSIHVKKEVI